VENKSNKKNYTQHLIKFILTFKLNYELINIQQSICYNRKISDIPVTQTIYKHVGIYAEGIFFKQETSEILRKNMKTLNVFFVVLFITISSINRVEAQSLDFYPMDENFELLQKFYKADTVLVVFPDLEPISAMDKQAIEKFKFWGKIPFFCYKKESDINAFDLKKNIQFFGPLFKFQNEYAEMPVKKTDHGFLYNTESFNQENDAFYYMNESANRLYMCKNSSKAISSFFSYGVGAYSFYIFRDSEIVYSGFANENLSKEKINDLNHAREIYFQQKTLSFFNLNIAKTLKVDSLFNLSSKALDNYVINLCDYLEVDTNNININLYAYADRIELQKFIAAPLWSTVLGKSVGNVLHTTQLDLSIVKHETAHSIIFQKIGGNLNQFWVEGFRQYTDYWFNNGAFNVDIEITKANIEFLDEELLSGSSKFFNHTENYGISGVFVKYMVDKIGFSEFKTVYSQQNIEEYITEKYEISMDELIAEFKDQL